MKIVKSGVLLIVLLTVVATLIVVIPDATAQGPVNAVGKGGGEVIVFAGEHIYKGTMKMSTGTTPWVILRDVSIFSHPESLPLPSELELGWMYDAEPEAEYVRIPYSAVESIIVQCCYD